MTNAIDGTVYVVNCAAGSGRAGRCWPRLAPLVPTDAPVLAADSPDEIDGWLDSALTEATRRVVIVGGDGSFHHLVNYVMARGLGARLELGLIPAGTGSDLARSLGLPRRPEAALALLRDAAARPLDLLAVDLGHGVVRHAANVASFGISAAVAADVRARARRHAHSYFTAAVRQLLRGAPTDVRLVRDGERWLDTPVWLIAAANGAYFGGGMHIAPDAHPDDGELDCIVVRGTGKARLIRQLPKVYFGRHLGSPDVAVARARRLDIELAGIDDWQAELDGETYAARTVSVRVVPNAVRVAAA